MKTKSKWSGAAFLMLALVLVAGVALVAAPTAPPAAAEDLAWSSVEGDFPLHGLPAGVGQIIDIDVSGNTVFVLADANAGADNSIEVYRSDDGGYRWEALPAITMVGVPAETLTALVTTGGTDGGDLLPETLTITYTNQAGVAGQVSPNFNIPMNAAVGTTVAIPLAAGDTGAIAVTGVTEVVSDDTTCVIDIVGDASGAVYATYNLGTNTFTAGAPPVLAAGTGVAIAISPNYSSDGTVVVLGSDGVVYTSTDRGVNWVRIPATLSCLNADAVGVDVANAMALTPNFNALLTGGTVVVGITWNAALTATTTYYASWQGPNTGWSGWTAAPSAAAIGDATLALECPPQNALYMVGVNVQGGVTYAQTALITAGFPAGGPVTVDQLPGPVASTSAVIALPDDFNPVGAAPAPYQFFVGVRDVGTNGALFWYDPAAGAWADTMAASTLPANNRDVAGLVSSGNYTRAQIIIGCYNVPITYNYDVRSQTWSAPSWIEGNGGPIGTVSNTVGVLLAYTGTGNTVYAATADLATLFTPGDLCCVSRSDDWGASWSDTCLTSENFRTNVNDMVWLDGQTGIITCDDGVGPWESTFKTWDKGLSWKRVDRWQDVTQVAAAPDGTIVLLDTGTTGTKVLVSTDNGETFIGTPVDPTLPVTKRMTAIAAGSATDIFVGDITGHIYVTKDGGATWTDLGALGARIWSLRVPDSYADAPYVAAGITSSTGMLEMLISSDGGASFAQWGSGSTQAAGWGAIAVAPGYIDCKFSPTFDGAADSLIYVHTVGAAWNDVYRGDLSATDETWVRTGCVPAAVAGLPVVQAFGIPAIDLVYIPGLDGVDGMTGNALYACFGAPLFGGGEMRGTWSPELVTDQEPYLGLWRLDSIAAGVVPAVNPFAVIQDLGALWGRNGVFEVVYSDAGADLFCVNSGAVPDLVRNWLDTAAFLTPPATTWPADGAIVPSNNTATGEPLQLQWLPVTGAMTYDVIVARDPMMLNRIWLARTGSLQCENTLPVGTLTDGETYYWRVRVAQHGGTTPGTNDHQGPWCETQSFTVEAVELHAAPDLISPESGATDVGIRPLFRWSGIEDATGYTLQVDDDPAFGSPVIDESLGVQQTYQPAAALDYDTTYHWRVQGSGADWTSPWAESLFTTIPEWAEPAPAATPIWIWVIIVIGALLALAVIVLIVRTRRAV
ncbi:MAG: hypothetical protein JRD89_06275 [Deltaproteobacteria bacterium]|nr:hypothetical protein [Deltaproteobacteria bacterium]